MFLLDAVVAFLLAVFDMAKLTYNLAADMGRGAASDLNRCTSKLLSMVQTACSVPTLYNWRMNMIRHTHITIDKMSILFALVGILILPIKSPY